MTRLTSINGAFGAHVLAARLHDEGFDVQLRGAVNGPYGFNVGDMGRVDVYVPEDQIEEASYVLLVTEVDNALDDEPRPRRYQLTVRAVAAVVLLFALLAAVAGGRTLF
jgi:hypothetical protein